MINIDPNIFNPFAIPATEEDCVELLKSNPSSIAFIQMLAFIEAISKMIVQKGLCTDDELISLQEKSFDRLLNMQAKELLKAYREMNSSEA